MNKWYKNKAKQQKKYKKMTNKRILKIWKKVKKNN